MVEVLLHIILCAAVQGVLMRSSLLICIGEMHRKHPCNRFACEDRAMHFIAL